MENKMWERIFKKNIDFNGSKEFLGLLNNKIPNKEDIETLVCYLKNSQNCQNLFDYMKKHPKMTTNEIWQKSISMLK